MRNLGELDLNLLVVFKYLMQERSMSILIDHQADVVQLDLLPYRHRLLAGCKFAFEPFNAGAHLQVIKLYALSLGLLLALPIHGLKALLGVGSHRIEHAVVEVEAMHESLCNGIGLGGVQSLRKHGGPVAPGK